MTAHGVWSHGPNVTEADHCPECQKVRPQESGLRAALEDVWRDDMLSLAQQAMQLAEHRPSLLRDDPAYRLAERFLENADRARAALAATPAPPEPLDVRDIAAIHIRLLRDAIERLIPLVPSPTGKGGPAWQRRGNEERIIALQQARAILGETAYARAKEGSRDEYDHIAFTGDEHKRQP